jgi:hypothetical protein
VDPGKIQDVFCWDTPKSVSDNRSFLGLARYYRRFIEGFSMITKPMIELLGKDNKYEWLAKCESRFQELKQWPTTAPVLVMPNMEKEFLIHCDASGQGLGCVLMQDGHVVAYASRQLRKHVEHYLNHDLELAVVVHALEIWRHYLIRKRCVVYSDCKSLKYIFTKLDLNLRQRRWLELIKDYDLGINYHAGKANIFVDALNQRTYLNGLIMENIPFVLFEELDKLNLRLVVNTVVVAMEVFSTLPQDNHKGQHEDEKEIKKNIAEGKFPGFTEDNQCVLWYKRRICEPDVKKTKNIILREAHNSAYSIHPEVNKMYQYLMVSYWWYGMESDIAEYVALCDTCQKVKAEHQRPVGLLQPLKVPEWKWDEIGKDFIVGLPRTQKG